MNKLIKLFFLFLLFAITNIGFSQDTLPNFSLKNAGKNRIVVSWTNTFKNIRQISIQRSFDSLSGYKSILTVADPTTTQNGFVDTKATNEHMFYRLYIMLDKGNYLFSPAKRPTLEPVITDTVSTVKAKEVMAIVDSLQKTIIVSEHPDSVLLKIDSVKRANPVVFKLEKFQTGDSILAPGQVVVKNRPNAFTPSLYVYTYRDGYVRVALPTEEKNYSIRFFDENNKMLFELKNIKEKRFKIDKASFYHAGWFRFELYENGILLEKNKFYLEKDF